MSVDYKQLLAFQKKIEKLNNGQKEEFLEACCKELAARLLEKVIKRTPVGVKPEVKGAKTIKVKVASSITVKKKAGNGYVTYQKTVMRTKSVLTAEGARYEQYWKDYHGGTLRRGWTAKTHEEAVKGSGNGKNAKEYANSLEIKRIGDKYHIDIINPVEYASYVEYGHRQEPGRYVPAIGKSLKAGWVDGHHMLTISESELNSMSANILQAKLNKFMKEVFKE